VDKKFIKVQSTGTNGCDHIYLFSWSPAGHDHPSSGVTPMEASEYYKIRATYWQLYDFM